MAIDVSQVADLLNTTLEAFDKGKLTDLTLDEQEHHFLPQLLREERVQYQSGHKVIFDVVKDINPARHHGLHDVDQILIKDVTVQGEVPWRFTTDNYAFDKHEVMANRDPSMIVNLLDTRRLAAWAGISKKIEDAGWSIPASSTDNTTPYGIKYYITKKVTGSSASTSTGEFGGGNPTNFSSGSAGIDSSATDRWKNWTHQYVDVTDDDLVDKMRIAFYKINFRSPVSEKYTENRRGPDKYVIYMPYDILRQLEKVAESKNENLGQDLAPFDGEVRFRRAPMRAVPVLDSDSDDPVYFINWSKMYVVGLKGAFLEESPVKPVPGMRNDVAAHIDVSWNLACVDRRAQAVISTAAAND